MIEANLTPAQLVRLAEFDGWNDAEARVQLGLFKLDAATAIRLVEKACQKFGYEVELLYEGKQWRVRFGAQEWTRMVGRWEHESFPHAAALAVSAVLSSRGGEGGAKS